MKKDLSKLPTMPKPDANPPDAAPYFSALLAEAWEAAVDHDDDKAMAFPEARLRHSWAGSCARRIGYQMTKAPVTEPIDVADHWRFGLGTIIHERWQDVLLKAFPEAEVERKVWIEECKSAGHVDLFVPRGHLLGRRGPDGELLDVDPSDREARLRSVLGRDSAGADAPDGVDVDERSDPDGVASGSSVSGEGVLQSDASGTGDDGGEQPSGGSDEDALPEGSSVHGGQPDPAEEPHEPGVQAVWTGPGERVVGGGTAIELKSINGFGMKMAIGARGPAEGPRTSAIIQGALNGLALDADEVVLVYLSTENLSPRELANLEKYGTVKEAQPWQKFAAEWTYTREQFEPIAKAEVARFKKILAVVDEGGLPPRAIPVDLPRGARITDPMNGGWQVVEDGMIIDSGSTWQCHYCPYQTHCAADAA